MIILEFLGAVLRFLYSLFFTKEKKPFLFFWKTYDLSTENASENLEQDYSNSKVGVIFVVIIIIGILVYDNF